MRRRSSMTDRHSDPVQSSEAAARSAAKTYVLVHGAWHGGWCWRAVADGLHSLGHRVTTPTLTGLGERKHQLTKDITLDTFVADIVNHIEAEELDDIILVGHSLGGAVITGAADRIPERIRHLVYLDGAILENGRSVFSTMPADIVAARRKLVAEVGQGVFMPTPAPTAFGVPAGHPATDWVARRMTPHPVGTYESPLKLDNPVGNGRPCTYVACTNPPHRPVEDARRWAKAQADWNWQELATAHDCMVTAPADVAALLAAIG